MPSGAGIYSAWNGNNRHSHFIQSKSSLMQLLVFSSTVFTNWLIHIRKTVKFKLPNTVAVCIEIFKFIFVCLSGRKSTLEKIQSFEDEKFMCAKFDNWHAVFHTKIISKMLL